MINPSFHLYQLQKLDLSIDSIIRRIVEIDDKMNNNENLLAAEKEVQLASKTLSISQTALSEVEQKIQAKRIKISQSESSLYSGIIINPKELQDIQSEIQSLKKAITVLEDQQLECLLDLEKKEKILDLKVQEKQRIKEDLTQSYQSLNLEKTDKNVEKNRLINERKLVTEQINESFMAVYDNLRKTKKGIAVSAIEDGTCGVCGSTLTPADCQIAKSPQKMATCSSCGRILYAG